MLITKLAFSPCTSLISSNRKNLQSLKKKRNFKICVINVSHKFTHLMGTYTILRIYTKYGTNVHTLCIFTYAKQLFVALFLFLKSVTGITNESLRGC